MDGDHVVHLSGVLPDTAVRHHVVGLGRSVLLDSCDIGVESRHAHGARHLAHRHVGTHHAAACRR